MSDSVQGIWESNIREWANYKANEFMDRLDASDEPLASNDIFFIKKQIAFTVTTAIRAGRTLDEAELFGGKTGKVAISAVRSTHLALNDDILMAYADESSRDPEWVRQCVFERMEEALCNHYSFKDAEVIGKLVAEAAVSGFNVQSRTLMNGKMYLLDADILRQHLAVIRYAPIPFTAMASKDTNDIVELEPTNSAVLVTLSDHMRSQRQELSVPIRVTSAHMAQCNTTGYVYEQLEQAMSIRASKGARHPALTVDYSKLAAAC